MQIFQIGREAANFFVYCCESERYGSLIKQFRQANSRQMLIDVIDQFLYLGESIKVQNKRFEISPTKWSTLLQFIEKSAISDIRKLHISMMGNIAMLEVDKIQRVEQYLDQLKHEKSRG